jgi:hypothetical protein
MVMRRERCPNTAQAVWVDVTNPGCSGRLVDCPLKAAGANPVAVLDE